MAAFSILVVEDDPLQQELTVIALQRVGVTEPVQCVSSGNAAISYISGDREYIDRVRFPLPRLVITDLQMPDGDGYSLLSYLQEHPADGPCRVAVLSSSDDERRIERAKRLGASRYIVKPASLEALCQSLHELLHEEEVFLRYGLHGLMPSAAACADESRAESLEPRCVPAHR